ncbi:MAG: hypothetical protein K8T91_26615 [Planctomycetes bacterium]|nr:hypothetical protein [Planctomycetota bacterium]
MKLGTIIAFCGGAAIVVATQHFLGAPASGPTTTTAKVRTHQTCEALSLLKTKRDTPATTPKPLTETPVETGEVAHLVPSEVVESTPPAATPAMPSEGSNEPPVAEPRYASTTTTVVAPAVDMAPALEPSLPGVTLPSVSPKVAGEFNLPKADFQPSSDPFIAAPDTSSPSTLQTVVNTVRDVGDRLNSVLIQRTEPQPAVAFVHKVPAQAEPAPTETKQAQENDTVRIAEQSNTGGSKPAPLAEKPKAAAPADSVSQEEMDALKKKVRRVLDNHRNRMLNTRDHGAWETMHSFIAYGVEKDIQVGGPSGRKVNAIGWLCFNGPSAGERLFTAGSAGPRGRTGPGLQGHEGQFLAMLAQSRVPLNFPMKVDGREYTVEDLVRQEQATCRPNSELTFKLIGLMHYLKSDDTWRDENGGEWGIPRLIKEELAQPIIGATCGGTHRLFGLTYAYKKRAQRGEPVTGQYRRAQVYIQDFQDYTFKMQNPDGSFSTAFFAGRGASPDLARRLETTGHITEWLTFSLDDKQLQERRMFKAVDYLATLLDENPDMNWKVGPLGHALHALNMYDSFVFGGTAYPRSSSEAPMSPRTAAADATPKP